MGREAAHSRRRIVHAHGDATGAELLRAVSEAARSAPHLTVHEYATLVDLTVARERVTGVRIALQDGSLATIAAPRVVIATGGSSAIYRYTTNPPGQWGAGLAVAARAGAMLSDLEFVQFHPTALAAGGDPMPLISEAVRGEGAVLVDEFGRRIMAGVDPRGDLAPRDVVARAVYREMRAGRSIFLDCRAEPGSGFAERFPTIFAACTAAGIDPRSAPIPIAPAAHYHMGGISVDKHGRASLAGLWACGEASATGLHGANRLASNSLLEALVFPRRVARDVAGARVGRSAPVSGPRGRRTPRLVRRGRRRRRGDPRAHVRRRRHRTRRSAAGGSRRGIGPDRAPRGDGPRPRHRAGRHADRARGATNAARAAAATTAPIFLPPKRAPRHSFLRLDPAEGVAVPA